MPINLGVKLRRGHRKDTNEPALILTSPYHPDFPKPAKRIGGRWDGQHWLFDVRDEERVAKLCERLYGVNPLTGPPEIVTVQTVIAESDWLGKRLWAFGRMLVERRHTDDDIWLGSGVIMIDGEFAATGGSRRGAVIGYPVEAVTLEIRDVPALLLASEKRSYTIIEDRVGEDLATERQVDVLTEQIQSLNPAERSLLLLRLRDLPIEDML